MSAVFYYNDPRTVRKAMRQICVKPGMSWALKAGRPREQKPAYTASHGGKVLAAIGGRQ
jgi:hypothetical protein